MSWFDDRPDRHALMAWLTAATFRRHNEFYERCLDVYAETRSLTPAQEAAVRKARKLADARKARESHEWQPPKTCRPAAGAHG